MARQDRERIHWAWLPAAAVLFVSGWVQFGPAVALCGALAGLGLGIALRKRGERRREAARLRRDRD